MPSMYMCMYGLYVERVESQSVLRYVCTLIGDTSKCWCLVCINVH